MRNPASQSGDCPRRAIVVVNLILSPSSIVKTRPELIRMGADTDLSFLLHLQQVVSSGDLKLIDPCLNSKGLEILMANPDEKNLSYQQF